MFLSISTGIFLAMSVIGFIAHLSILSGKNFHPLVNNTAFALLWIMAAIIFGFGCMLWFINITPYALFLWAGLCYGPMRLPVCIFSEKFADKLILGNPNKMRIQKECAMARAAEKRGDLAEAERLFRDELTGKGIDDALVYLSLGNILLKQDKFRDAAVAWRKAIEFKDGLDELAIVATAVRLSELLEERLGEKRAAAEVLKQTLERYPKSAEVAAITQRLSSLNGR